ncbi:MAG: site-specific DNA-methyltransferase [Defluviitaleaceae bacterium]|nr:site-specific DNA-methyltransferase [Defluviitaleaceae bacterium]
MIDIENKIIYGDNLEILKKFIDKNFIGKVDLIYIDPPFSTNNDFIVNDRISTISMPKNGNIAYSDKFSKNEYLKFLKERLILLNHMLSEKGSLYLHIDVKIGHYVKILLDEIFGEENFISEITRKKSNPKNFSRKAYGNEKDTIFFYAKKKGNHIWNDVTIPYSDEELKVKYPKIDNNGRYYNTVPIHAPGESLGETGAMWNGMYPPEGRHWRTSPKELDRLNELGLIEWSNTGNPRMKKFADEHKGKKIQDIWLNFKDPMYPIYPTEKNSDMLDLIIKQSSLENSIVMDIFAGSGGTLISAKKNKRSFIGIDNSEVAIKTMFSRGLNILSLL